MSPNMQGFFEKELNIVNSKIDVVVIEKQKAQNRIDKAKKDIAEAILVQAKCDKQLELLAVRSETIQHIWKEAAKVEDDSVIVLPDAIKSVAKLNPEQVAEPVVVAKVDLSKRSFEELLFVRIGDLGGLSKKANNRLRSAGIFFLLQLVEIKPEELKKVRYCGEMLVGKIAGLLANNGFKSQQNFTVEERLMIGQYAKDHPEILSDLLLSLSEELRAQHGKKLESFFEKTSNYEQYPDLSQYQLKNLFKHYSQFTEINGEGLMKKIMELTKTQFVVELALMTDQQLLSYKNFGPRRVPIARAHLMKCGIRTDRVFSESQIKQISDYATENLKELCDLVDQSDPRIMDEIIDKFLDKQKEFLKEE